MNPPDASAAIMEAAIRWWTARHGGHWSPEQEQHLADWLEQDPAHRQAYLRVARVWELAGTLPAQAVPAPARQRRRRLELGLGGLMLLAMLLWQASGWWLGQPVTWQSDARQEEIALEDGSRVTLAPASAVQVRLGRGQRQIHLLRGEALFQVAHETRRPFQVSAGTGQVTDLGTVFHVALTEGGVSVGVMEGLVAIDTPKGRLQLSAGEGSRYGPGGEIAPPYASWTSQEQWTRGRRTFHDEPLGAILERFRQRHGTRFELLDEALAALPVSGSFSLDDPAPFIATLSAGFPVQAQAIPGGWELQYR